ncbi:MarR family transcriptional regulator [Cellulomonas sp. DKR-3]|uniref:MarR family transcriptional regulator n=1 Tax=Cellulomonas fulva TaxID=2835530 RepID=A0ABS5TV85_9CELL|nr:MarR family transcriptional regulator [Cellulomonas fulva]MBT0993040.1 MarR family transcriptional regulator [Cellulomonas fulva]
MPVAAPALAGELRAAVIMAARRIRAERGSADLTDPQYSVLVHLEKRGPLTPGQLADIERIQPPSMTRTVNCLVEDGLVAKAAHPTDGRVVVVSLTEAGRTEVVETRHRRSQWLAAQLEGMTPDEQDRLADAVELLRRISQA